MRRLVQWMTESLKSPLSKPRRLLRFDRQVRTETAVLSIRTSINGASLQAVASAPPNPASHWIEDFAIPRCDRYERRERVHDKSHSRSGLDRPARGQRFALYSR